MKTANYYPNASLTLEGKLFCVWADGLFGAALGHGKTAREAVIQAHNRCRRYYGTK